jgi:hypothetical protein
MTQLTAERQTVPCQVETIGIAVLSEPRDIGAGAASTIEKSWRRSTFDRAHNLWLNEPSKPAKPEVRLLREVSKLQESIHAVGGARSSCYHTPLMRPRGPIEATLVLLAATAITIAATYPVAFHITNIGRVNTDDGRWSIWVVSWVAHKLTTDPLNVFHANIFYPHRYTLAFSEANIGAGAMAAPVWIATHNPYTTHNIVFLASFVIAFAGAYYLTRYLSGNRLAAFLAGIMFAFCPFIFARTAHIQLLFTGLLPFCLLAFHRLADRPSVQRSVTLGVALWITTLCCAYYGIFAGLMIALATIVLAITRGLWRSKDYLIAIALAAFISVGLALPFLLPYLYVQEEMGFVRTLNDARPFAADLGAWGASAAWAHRWWLPALGNFSDVLFPGILATTLGLTGAVWLFRRPHTREVAILYSLLGVLAFWASFGPDAGLYRLFYTTIPIFSFLRAPGRMGIMVTLALTVLASYVVADLLNRVRRPALVGAALVAAALGESATVPLTQFREAEPLSPVYRVLATLPPGPVAEFPYWYERSDFPRHAYYMLNSTAHWKPLVNGYSDHIPQDFRRTVIPLSSFPSRESFFILARTGTRYVVFHLDMYNTALRERLFQQLDTYSPYLRPLAQEGPVWLFEIVGWPN